MNQNHVFGFCAIFFALFEDIICAFDVNVPTLDATMFYKSVHCLGKSDKYPMFEFTKHDECRDVYSTAGDSPRPDHDYIYLSTKDIREKSSSDNIVKFRANNKNYVVEFEDASQANYFMEYMDFDSGFKVQKVSETIRYTDIRLKFVENEELFQFQRGGTTIQIECKDFKVSRVDSMSAPSATLRKTNGLKEYKIVFSSKAHRDQFAAFFE